MQNAVEIKDELKLVAMGVKSASVFVIDSEEEKEKIKKIAGRDLHTLETDTKEKNVEHWIMVSKNKALLDLVEFSANFIYKRHFLRGKETIFRTMVGIACGIPLCCAKNYYKLKGSIIRCFESYMGKLGKRKDPYNLRLVVSKSSKKVLGVAHSYNIFHIPCSPDCEGTRALAKVYGTARGKLRSKKITTSKSQL